MNVKLLQRVKQVILEEPMRLDMDISISTIPKHDHCETVACIAGWTVLLDKTERLNCSYLDAANRTDNVWPDVKKNAQKLLDIDRTQMAELAFQESWPTDLYNEYETHALRGNHERMAKVTAKRIDQFIEKYK